MNNETCTMERTQHKITVADIDIEVVQTGLGPYVVIKADNKTVNVSVVDGYMAIYVDGEVVYQHGERNE